MTSNGMSQMSPIISHYTKSEYASFNKIEFETFSSVFVLFDIKLSKSIIKRELKGKKLEDDLDYLYYFI